MTRFPDLEALIDSADTDGLVIELDNFIGEVCDYGDEMDKLTPSQRMFYLNQNLEREVKTTADSVNISLTRAVITLTRRSNHSRR